MTKYFLIDSSEHELSSRILLRFNSNYFSNFIYITFLLYDTIHVSSFRKTI